MSPTRLSQSAYVVLALTLTFETELKPIHTPNSKPRAASIPEPVCNSTPNLHHSQPLAPSPSLRCAPRRGLAMILSLDSPWF